MRPIPERVEELRRDYESDSMEYDECFLEIPLTVLTTALTETDQQARAETARASYTLAVNHLKEAYAHNATTTVPEAIAWLEDNSRYAEIVTPNPPSQA